MISPNKFNFVLLVILDGWGIAPPGKGNAITLAKTPNMNKLLAMYPHTQLMASGEAVGLPRGEDGNTETGHMNLGAGRIVYQDLERINMSIADGTFFKNDVLLKAMEHSKKNKSDLHLMGLVGAGGVHSSLSHLFSLIHMSNITGIKNLKLHLFTDGRDSPPTSAKTYVDMVTKNCKKEGVGKIATVMGRYWAMDRDQHWDRTEKAYKALTKGIGKSYRSADEAIEKSYAEGKTDEFIEPSIITDENGKPEGLIKNNDTVIFFNFRIDRPRQLTKSFVFKDFSKAPISFEYDPYTINYEGKHISANIVQQGEPFKRGERLENLYFVTMTEYGKPITQEGAFPAFPPEIIGLPLSGVISLEGKRQLKITESEKERFVTFYFNGLREDPFPQEDRIIIPSPNVSTYDKKPEMSADKITDEILKKLNISQYSLIVVNYPNADMVGHTGNIKSTITAVEKIDDCIGKLSGFISSYEGALLITADHGNSEEMLNPLTNETDTEHSVNPVPFIAVSKSFLGKAQTLPSGILADVAPTVLSLLGINIPSEMSGRNLLSTVV